MHVNGLITRTIHAAIDEVNASPGIPTTVGKSPDTVLVGLDGALDSMGFVTFITAFEESLEQSLERSVDVMDLFVEDLESSWTVGELAERVRKLLEDT